MTRKTTLKGQQMMLFIDDAVIPLSTSCKISLSNELGDDSTKDDGIWGHETPTKKTWSVTNESLLNTTDPLYISNIEYAYEHSTDVEVIIGIPSNYNDGGVDATDEQSWQTPSGTIYLFGVGKIESIDYDAAKGDFAKATITIKGEGELSTPPIAIVNLTPNPATSGYVEGSGAYLQGTQVTIKAVPNTGKTFTKWSDNNTTATRTITVNSDTNLTAIFSA